MKLSLSIAASWAWGTSLIVGMQIAQQKGLIAWGIWAGANCLTLALFGALTRSGFLSRRVFESKWIKWSAIGIQIFCLIIQLNILNTIALQMGAGPVAAYLFATTIGVIFTLWMYRHGLRMSILTDKYQALFTGAVLLAIIGIALGMGVPTIEHTESSLSDIAWGVWSACILFAGPIGDIQHYQRAEVAGKANSYSMAAGLFAIYMGLVLTMSFFEFNFFMNSLLILAVVFVTSSTIDSIAVALHEIANKKVGTAVALFVCFFWGLFASMGIIDLWSKAGVFRVVFALLIVVFAQRNRARIRDISDVA